MSITYEPRAGDARALVVSLGLGAFIGLAVGGAYIVGGIARDAVSKPLLAQADRLQIPAPKSDARPEDGGLTRQTPVGQISSSSTPASLRDRFSLALALTRSVVQPFHFKSADVGAEDHSRDTQCLAQAVYYEARGESASGQAAVAQVVLNRVRHPAFPKTVCGVVFQHAGADCQFSFACNGAMHQPLERAAWRRALAVADRALSGSVMSEVGAATHFQAARSADGWAGSLAKVAQVGEHIFYRFSGRAGAPRLFQAEAQRSAPDADTQVEGDAGRVHAVFTAAASQSATSRPEPKAALTALPAGDGKAVPVAPTATPAMASAKATVGSPDASGENGDGVQALKTVETEKPKPIATATTQS